LLKTCTLVIWDPPFRVIVYAEFSNIKGLMFIESITLVIGELNLVCLSKSLLKITQTSWKNNQTSLIYKHSIKIPRKDLTKMKNSKRNLKTTSLSSKVEVILSSKHGKCSVTALEKNSRLFTIDLILNLRSKERVFTTQCLEV
jgi:hypothetical protein